MSCRTWIKSCAWRPPQKAKRSRLDSVAARLLRAHCGRSQAMRQFPRADIPPALRFRNRRRLSSATVCVAVTEILATDTNPGPMTGKLSIAFKRWPLPTFDLASSARFENHRPAQRDSANARRSSPLRSARAGPARWTISAEVTINPQAKKILWPIAWPTGSARPTHN